MVELTLTNEYASYLLLINGLAILFYIGAKKKNRQRAMRFGNYETLQKVAGKNFLKSSNIVLITRLLALTLLIIGISSPALIQNVTGANSDYVVAIESSTSMLESDVDPNRFEASKQVSREFISNLGNGTKVGFVTFAGEAETGYELSDDLGEVSRTIDSATTGETAGTAMGDAISLSSSMLSGAEKNRSIVMITAGRNTAGMSVEEALEFAETQDVTIHTVGIGSENRSSEQFGLADGQNATVAGYPNLNSTQLSMVANRTGGSYTEVTETRELRDAVIQVEEDERREDLSSYFILMAAGLLLLEWVLGNTRYSVIP